MEVTPLDFRKIDFSRVQIGALALNESGKGMSAKIQYLNDKGVPENFIIQTPIMQFPYGISNYNNENTNFSLSGTLDEKVPILRQFSDFLKKFDDFIVKHAFNNAKTILGKNAEVTRDDGTKGPITLGGMRMFHNSLIKEPNEDKKASGYSNTFKTTVYPTKDNNVIVPDTYNFKCVEHDGHTPSSTNIPHHSTGSMHFQPATFYSVSGKYGVTNVLKKVVLQQKGGYVESKHIPNMYGEQPPVDIYDEAVEQAIQEAETKKKPLENDEDENPKPSKKSKTKK
jgi:hypothetical protein